MRSPRHIAWASTHQQHTLYHYVHKDVFQFTVLERVDSPVLQLTRSKAHLAAIKDRISKLHLITAAKGGTMEEADQEQLQDLMSDLTKVGGFSNSSQLCRNCSRGGNHLPSQLIQAATQIAISDTLLNL